MKNRRRAEFLLMAVIIARSTSYLFAKTCLSTMGPFNLLSLRFTIAFLLLAPALWMKRRCISRKTLGLGALLGLSFFLVMGAETLGLRETSTTVASLLENMAIILVPLFASLLYRRKPSAAALLSCLTAFGGAALIILREGGFALSRGMLLCLLAAVFYTAAILLTDRLVRMADPFVLGVLQLGFMALYSSAAALMFERPALPQSPLEWGCVLELAVVCSGFGFALQPLAQRGTSPERAGLFCALNPAAAAVWGAAFLGERLGFMGMAGAGLILAGILLSKLLEARAARRRADQPQGSSALMRLSQ